MTFQGDHHLVTYFNYYIFLLKFYIFNRVNFPKYYNRQNSYQMITGNRIDKLGYKDIRTTVFQKLKNPSIKEIFKNVSNIYR